MSPWKAAGLVTTGDFYSEGTLLTFDELLSHTKIPSGNFLAYCAIRHLLHISWGLGDIEPPVSQILTLLLSMGDDRRVVSRLNTALLLDALPRLDHAKPRWDKLLPAPCP
ncbi:hypothetical protein NDU88_007929 [Pleurodeles waltl]|uniref:Uncharacterized protein n=1 Tax=Pleurodeles waltl TaxID=8319 RepID=A0AAV7VS67_PLEWA|nr:hypothetical protein NDU88_007929 [Pleurodeles waltl]